MSISSPLKLYHFQALIIWWHSPFKISVLRSSERTVPFPMSSPRTLARTEDRREPAISTPHRHLVNGWGGVVTAGMIKKKLCVGCLLSHIPGDKGGPGKATIPKHFIFVLFLFFIAVFNYFYELIWNNFFNFYWTGETAREYNKITQKKRTNFNGSLYFLSKTAM